MTLERIILVLVGTLLSAGVLLWLSQGAHALPKLTAWLWLIACLVSFLPLILWVVERVTRR